MIEDHVFLVGMPGSGKSEVGMLLAERVGLPFADLDRVVEERAGRSVAAIFRGEGEAAFRRLESAELRRIAVGSAAVVACGGGVVLDRGNVEAMRLAGTVVYLEVSGSTLKERLRPYRDRPLVKDDEDVDRLLAERAAVYAAAADVVVDGSGQPDEVADAVEEALG